jgi:uncharacterized protein YjcR
MSRPRSPNRDKAFKIYKEHDGRITSKEIADKLNEKINNINTWRVRDKWKLNLNKVGAPYGNKNALGNKGGRAAKENVNSYKYGLYSERIPLSVKNIMEELETDDPLEKLWKGICLQEARIIYMQEIMHVESKDDITRVLKKISKSKGSYTEEYEIQFPWDKEANLVNTQSKAMAQLTSMIKKYDEMVHANWNIATEEQKLRVKKLITQIDNNEFEHKKEVDKEKLRLERERFEHQKDNDSKKYW